MDTTLLILCINKLTFKCQEIEAIEEQWRIESRELVSVVSRLQDENRRLVKVQGCAQGADDAEEPSSPDSDVMLQRLQTVIDKQREELRVKERKLQEKTSECESVIFFRHFY